MYILKVSRLYRTFDLSLKVPSIFLHNLSLIYYEDAF
jgi:hypothetical protein